MEAHSPRRMSRACVTATLLFVGLLLALGIAAPAQAGQIVYAHGGDLWAMNDDGSAQRPLLTAAQAGAAIDFGSNADPQPVSVQPGGTGVAFVGHPPTNCPAQTSNCPALYSFIGGKLTRLTAASAACGSVGISCASEEEDPAVTADGRIVYERLDVASTFTCFYYCGFSGGYDEAYYVRKLDGSDAPLAWPVPPLPEHEADNEGVDPNFEGPDASDPADPSKLAYQGNHLLHDPGGSSGTIYPLDIDASVPSPPASSQPSYDDSFIYGLAFSGDGSLLADVETGTDKGIWVYPSGQSWISTPEYPAYWALEDPDNGQGESLTHFINGLAFVGNGELVFGANYNLYSLPARCWATPTVAPAKADCKFPQDATQLTTDGSAAAPDTSPAWTSSTAPITAYSNPPGPEPPETSVSHASLGGIAEDKPDLAFTVSAAAGSPPLKTIEIDLPHGLSFAKARKALAKGITVRSGGKKLKFAAKLSHGHLILTLTQPASKVELTLVRPAILVSKILQSKVRHRKVKTLGVIVKATNVSGRTTSLIVELKPR